MPSAKSLTSMPLRFLFSVFIVYPNPVSDFLYLHKLNRGIYKISILNELGQTIKTENKNLNGIDVSDLADGIYFLKLFASDSMRFFSFIKQQ